MNTTYIAPIKTFNIRQTRNVFCQSAPYSLLMSSSKACWLCGVTGHTALVPEFKLPQVFAGVHGLGHG